MGRFGPAIGAEQLGGSVYELDPGESVCPYHYEYPEEEWLLVLAGRRPSATRTASTSSSRATSSSFREGPDGAHKVTNRRTSPSGS